MKMEHTLSSLSFLWNTEYDEHIGLMAAFRSVQGRWGIKPKKHPKRMLRLVDMWQTIIDINRDAFHNKAGSWQQQGIKILNWLLTIYNDKISKIHYRQKQIKPQLCFFSVVQWIRRVPECQMTKRLRPCKIDNFFFLYI